MKKLHLLLAFIFLVTCVGCGNSAQTTTSEQSANSSAVANSAAENTVVLYTSTRTDVLDPCINQFEAATGIKVELVEAGTAELFKRVEAEKDNPICDVLWGVNIDATLVPEHDLFEDYLSPNDEFMADSYKNIAGHTQTFSVGPNVLVVNTDLIGDIKVECFADLLNPELKGKIATSDPSKTNSGFGHVINQLYAMGNGDPDKGWDYVEKLIENLDGKLLSGSSNVHKGVADGEYVVGLIYEAGVVPYVRDGAPVKIVYMTEGVTAPHDGAGIVKGAPHLENAKAFIDFLTGKEFQTYFVNELQGRSGRTDIPMPEDSFLPSLDEINLIFPDPEWTSANSQDVIDRFLDIYTSKQ